MSADTPQLIDPTEGYYQEYIAFLAEYGNDKIHGIGMHIREVETFTDYLKRLDDAANGEGLPEGIVPGNTYWLVRGQRMLGTCNLRHRLNENLLHYGGHIGYSIRPSGRRKGYATILLRLAIGKARDRGIDRVLVTCDKDNIASARVIQKNGGVLESEIVLSENGGVGQRYWIDCGAGKNE